MKIKLKKYKIVKSTNDVAIKLIKKNVVDPTLIISKKQTAGRGRVGKKWISKRRKFIYDHIFQIRSKQN